MTAVLKRRDTDSLARLLADAHRLIAEGRALLAAPLLEDALAQAPRHPEVRRLLAVRALTIDQPAEAIVHARAACEAAPRRGDLRLVLGRAHKACGQLDDALEAYRAAVNLDPQLAEAHVSLGIALKLKGQLSDAIACYRRALEINPRLAAAHANLGNALVLQADRLAAHSGPLALDAAAEDAHRHAIELDPANPQAHANFARSLERAGSNDRAIDLLNAALGMEPDNEDICLALIGVLHKVKHYEGARDVLDTWLAANPAAHPTTVNCMAMTLLHLDKYTEALKWARKADALAPDRPDVLYSIGAAQMYRLQMPQSLETFRRITQMAPGFAMAQETLVLCVNYVETDPERVLEDHRAFGRAITRDAPADAPALAPLRTKPRLRVGLLSGDLRRHSVGYFMEPIFEAHDPEHIELVAYHCTTHFDEVSERLKSHAQRWVACAGQTDEELVRRIRGDGIDVLIDLAGTTAEGRPAVFAQRAAPVQVSYLGYPTTTGIPAMDFRISDAVIDPVGHERYSTERLLRCATTMFCYRPDNDSDVGEPPLGRNGCVTFGTFNSLAKYSDLTLQLWADVLRAVPASRLLLKTKPLGDADVRERLIVRFAQLGIGSDRLLLNPWRPDLRSHLELYREVDIALDTYPYNGATTTCEALWAGVPVVTLRGRTHTSRMGASILTAIDRSAWIADDAACYVEIAAALARQPDTLAQFRAQARAVMRASPLMDARAHTRDFEQLLFQAWDERMAAGIAP